MLNLFFTDNEDILSYLFYLSSVNQCDRRFLFISILDNEINDSFKVTAGMTIVVTLNAFGQFLCGVKRFYKFVATVIAIDKKVLVIH